MQHTVIDGREQVTLTKREKRKYEECQVLTQILARFYGPAKSLAAELEKFMQRVGDDGRLKTD